MQAVYIKIHNYRSFTDASVNLAAYSLLLGANNAGKSNFLDAIRVFYDDIKYDEVNDFPLFDTNDQDSWIEVKYQPTQSESALLKSDYKQTDGSFIVRKYLRIGSEKCLVNKTGIYGYVGDELSTTFFYGAKNVQQAKVGRLIYIPDVSKLDEHTKLSGPSALRELLGTLISKVLIGSSSYEQLQTAFHKFESQLKNEQTEDGQSLTKLEDEISNALQDWDTKFEIDVNPISPEDIVKNSIGHHVQDSLLNAPQNPSYYGQGFQRHLIYSNTYSCRS